MTSRKNCKRFVLLYTFLITSLFCLQMITSTRTQLRQDSLFHIGRIAMLAEGMKNGDLFPLIYPNANFGYGYGTPIFYCNIPNYPFAILNVIGVPISICYSLEIIFYTFLSCASMAHLVFSVTKNRSLEFRTWASVLGATAYLFSNYHISDVWVRGALGEIVALAVIPFVIENAWRIVYEGENCWMCFGIGVACLAFSHNISFVLTSVLIILIAVSNFKNLNKNRVMTLGKGTLVAFLLSLPFTIPMLEQLHAQKLIVSQYTDGSALKYFSMSFSQFFSNIIQYRSSGRDVKNPLVVNVGWFLTFAPITYCFSKEKNRFFTFCFIVGYIFMILPSSIFPWQYISWLAWIQFPWRLNVIALPLLTIVASYGCVSVITEKKQGIIAVLLSLLIAEGYVHIYLPFFDHDPALTPDITWEEIRESCETSSNINLKYNNSEVALGEYLPVSYPDYRHRPNTATDLNGNRVKGVTVKRNYNVTTITVSSNYKGIVKAPLVWYKGYQIKDQRGSNVKVIRSNDGLVSFNVKRPGKYIVTFHRTEIGRWCDGIATVTVIVLFIIELNCRRKFLH